MIVAPTVFLYVYNSNGNTVYSSPLSNTSLPSTNGSVAQTNCTSLNTVSVYFSTIADPTGGELYARACNETNHFCMVRQGRFLQYGFYGLMDRYYSGFPLTVNLVNEMTAF